MDYNVKTQSETVVPLLINYIITFDGYRLPLSPASIRRTLRGREEISYQESMGSFIQKTYTPGLEELQLDIYLPKVNTFYSMFKGNRSSEIGLSYSHIKDNKINGFLSNTWLDIATSDVTIGGQNAIIEKMIGSLRTGKEINVVIERVQGNMSSGTAVGRRLMTNGKYIVSALDVLESAESAMWAILSVSLIEYKKPVQYTADITNTDNIEDVDNYIKCGYVLGNINLNGANVSGIRTQAELMVGASPRQLIEVLGIGYNQGAAQWLISKLPRF
jgi:hypothetical protein